jgi:hypothetical protein
LNGNFKLLEEENIKGKQAGAVVWRKENKMEGNWNWINNLKPL